MGILINYSKANYVQTFYSKNVWSWTFYSENVWSKNTNFKNILYYFAQKKTKKRKIIHKAPTTFSRKHVFKKIIGESGVKWDKKIFLSHTRKIHKLWKFCLCYIVERALIYIEEFFHAFELLILAAIEWVKIWTIFRNREKRGANWDKVCPKWDKFYLTKNNNY